mgnify:CR=1 FL=1
MSENQQGDVIPVDKNNNGPSSNGDVVTLVEDTMPSIVSITNMQKFKQNGYSIFGYRVYNVISGSMMPEYNIGDILISKEKFIQEVQLIIQERSHIKKMIQIGKKIQKIKIS